MEDKILSYNDLTLHLHTTHEKKNDKKIFQISPDYVFMHITGECVCICVPSGIRSDNLFMTSTISSYCYPFFVRQHHFHRISRATILVCNQPCAFV